MIQLLGGERLVHNAKDKRKRNFKRESNWQTSFSRINRGRTKGIGDN